MMRTLAAGAFLALAAALPAQQAAAQNPLGGAIGGAIVGGAIGGAVGHGNPGGIIAGAAIGAATGAIIANEAERRNGGYFWWHNACYYRYPNGAWVQVGLNYCGY
jgi:outer membrane lipoprotein SlyB